MLKNIFKKKRGKNEPKNKKIFRKILAKLGLWEKARDEKAAAAETSLLLEELRLDEQERKEGEK